MRSRPFVAWGRPFGEGEGLLGAGGGNEGVSGRGGEIDEKRSEAADREAVVGLSGGLLGDGGRGGFGDDAGTRSAFRCIRPTRFRHIRLAPMRPRPPSLSLEYGCQNDRPAAV
jgi:hypothetical protein